MIIFDPPLNIVLTNKTLKVTELPLVIIDSQKNKTCKAQSAPFYKTITLWENESYDAIGNYTQEQAENRFLELLGDDPASELAKLYVVPVISKKE